VFNGTSDPKVITEVVTDAVREGGRDARTEQVVVAHPVVEAVERDAPD
jgi:hypothetical protein